MAEQLPRKSVWILGAGFSRSLGGPLMPDLLSLAARSQILSAFSNDLSRDDVDLIFWLFHCGAGFPEGSIDPRHTSRGEKRWQDPEQFLEILDNATTDPSKEAVVTQVLAALAQIPTFGSDLVSKYPGAFKRRAVTPCEQLVKLARRMVSASCCAFLEGITRENALSKERWLPYQNWLSVLRASDSILTFNYDLVVETLHPSIGEDRFWGVGVAGVHDTLDSRNSESLARARDMPLLYKLHGSVDWNVDGNRVEPQSWTSAMLREGNDIAIATPGDSKMKMAGGIFARLWQRAEHAVREADDVFIIGFRFPQSDAFPRDRLLSALRENEKQSLNVHIVLGPEQKADQRRVLSLLRWTINVEPTFDRMGSFAKRHLIAQSMWAEDFLSVWAPIRARHLSNALANSKS